MGGVLSEEVGTCQPVTCLLAPSQPLKQGAALQEVERTLSQGHLRLTSNKNYGQREKS